MKSTRTPAASPITATGTTTAFTHVLGTSPNPQSVARVTVSGTWTTGTFTIDGIQPSGSAYSLCRFVDASAPGTNYAGTASPSDSTTTSYLVDVRGLSAIRVYPSAGTGLSVVVEVSSGNPDEMGSVPNTSAVSLTAVNSTIYPATNDGAALGDTTHNWSDLFLATGAVINYNNGNVAVTHSSGILTMGTGELRITTAGTNSASVPTLGSTSTLTNKTLTTPTLTTPLISTGLTASGSTSNDFSGSTGTFKSSTGTNTLGGNTIFKIVATPVAATGAAGGVAGAAALGAANVLYVSSDGATKGVKLLTGVAGDVKWILNTSSTACNLFAASGGTINGGAGDAGCAIPASKGVLAYCSAADTWTVFDMAAHSGAAA